jgi:hypothetical protein
MKSEIEQAQEIITEALENGEISEKQIKKLQRLSRQAGRDLTNNLMGEDGIKVDFECSAKGLVWLYKQLRKRNCPLSNREKSILEEMSNGRGYFTFKGFWSDGHNEQVPYWYAHGQSTHFCYLVFNGEIQIKG